MPIPVYGHNVLHADDSLEKLPELDWQDLALRQASLFERAPDTTLPTNLQPLELLLGHRFRRKGLLVEAVTHASCNIGSESLERLEFLGDSILDNIVVTAAYAHPAELSNVKLHLLRTALVNADFLAFICMEMSTEQETGEVIQHHSEGETTFKTVSKKVSIPLWKFMRHHSPKVGQVQAVADERHAALRKEINESIRSGKCYPWSLLSRVCYEKFYSDMIESILGGMYS